MAAIQQYQQRTQAQAGLGAGPSAMPSGLGSGLGDIAEAQSFLKQKAERVAEENAATWATERLSALQSQWTADVLARKESADPGAPEFTKQVLADYDAKLGDSVKDAPTPNSQRFMRERLAAFRVQLANDAQVFEATARAGHTIAIGQESIDSARNEVQVSPGVFQERLAERLTLLDSMRLSSKAREDLKVYARKSLSADAVTGLITRNPRDTLKALNSEPGKSGQPAVEALDPDDRMRLRNMAEAEIRQREAEARARQAEQRDMLRDQVADAFAAKQIGLPAMLPSKGAFQAAYGADGSEQYKVATQRWEAYDIAAQVALLPPQEAAEKLAAMRPTEQAGADDKLQAYQLGVQLYAEQRKRLEADPAAVLQQSDPVIQAAAQAMAGSPEDQEAVNGYFRAMAARQSVLGVEKPKLLSDAQAQVVASGLVFDPNAPKKRAETITQMREVYGNWLPQVLQEVAPSLDGHARVLVNMAPEYAARLDTALAQKKEIEDSIPSTAKTDITAELDAGLADFASSLSDNPDAAARVSEHREAAKLLAQDLVLRGSQPQDAARSALQAVVNGNYEYKGQGGNAPMLRIPVSADADAVQRGALSQRQRLSQGTDFSIAPAKVLTHDGLPARRNSDGSLSTEVSITVTHPRLNGGRPTNIPSLWGGRELDEEGAVEAALGSGQQWQAFGSISEAESAAKARSDAGGAGSQNDAALKDLQAAIRRSGYWVVNQDETGLVLKIPHRTGQGVVRRKDGSPVQMSWRELQETVPAEIDAQPYLFRGPME